MGRGHVRGRVLALAALLMLGGITLGQLVPTALQAESKPPPDPARFRAAFEEAWNLVRLGRKLEGRALLSNLSYRLNLYEPATRYRFAEQLADALNSLADPESADRVHSALVDTCVFEITHRRSVVEDLSHEPKARGLELCRFALSLASGVPQRRMLLRGAMANLKKVADGNAEVQHRLGLCYLELGDHKKALELFRSAVEDLPKEPKARGLELCHYALGLPQNMPQRRMLLRGAMASLKQVADGNAEVQHRLGLCYMEMGEHKKALELFTAAVASDPESPGPRVALARLVLADNKPTEALATLEKGLEKGMDKEGVELLGQVLAAMDAAGDGAKAREAAANWASKPGDAATMAPLWAAAAGFADKDGRLADALDGYCKVVAVDSKPDTVAAVGRIARLQLAKGGADRHAAAQSLAKSIKPDNATNPDLLKVAGELAFKDDDAVTAIKMYGAGLGTKSSKEFEPLLTELKHTYRTSKKFDLAAEVDCAMGAPKFAEADKTYAIVEFNDQRCAVDSATGTIVGKLPSNPVLADFSKTIGKVLKEYPPQFLQKLRLWKIELTESPAVGGQTWTGTADPENVTVHVNVRTAVTGPDDWRAILHHELFHLLDQQDDGKLSPDFVWNKCNRPGFLYSQTQNVPCEPMTGMDATEQAGFVHAYCTVGVEEDKAITFANMMIHYKDLEEYGTRDPELAAKLNRIRGMTAAFCPAMDLAFWTKVKKAAPASSVAAAPDNSSSDNPTTQIGGAGSGKETTTAGTSGGTSGGGSGGGTSGGGSGTPTPDPSTGPVPVDLGNGEGGEATLGPTPGN